MQWKNGDDDWHNLVKLDDIRSNSAVGKDGTNGADGKNGINGKDGKNIQIRNNGNYIQWRYLNENWNNLVAVSDITGSNGKNGTDGKNGTNGTNGINGINGKDGICKGYFAAYGESFKNSWNSALSFTEKANTGNVISYNKSTNEITLAKGRSYSVVFNGTVSVSANKEDVVCGASLTDGYTSETMMATKTFINSPKKGLENRLTVAYNTIYTATENITLKFSYFNMLFLNTDFLGRNYNITIIALD